MKFLFKKTYIGLFLILQLLILASCGGGSSGSSGGGQSNPTPNGPSNTDTPTVTMIQPTNGSINVDVGTDIKLRFNTPVNNVSESTITIYGNSYNGNKVDIASITAESNNTYKIRPSVALDYSTQYFVEVSNDITSVENNQPVPATAFYFTTKDSTATPTVKMTQPVNESINVQVNTTIELKFDQPVLNVNNSTITVQSESGDAVNGVITAESHNAYKFTPSNLLDYNTKYYVQVGDGITSFDGNLPVAPITFNFTTSQEIKAPTVSIESPVNNSIVNTVYPEITIKFSESVTGVSTSTIQLRKDNVSGSIVSSSVVDTGSGNVYKLVPNTYLKFDTVYYIVINNGITSKATGLAVAPTSSKFITYPPSFAYVTYNNGISACKINATGQFDSCSLIPSTPANASSVTIDPSNQFAYITSKNSSAITACAVDQHTGFFSSCTTNTSFRTPTSIAFNATESSMYYTDGISSVYRCPISVIGSLPTYTQCGVTGGSFSGPTSIVVDKAGVYSYTVNKTNKSITTCSINPPTGSLTGCSATASILTNPLDTALSSDGKYLLVTDGTSVKSCPVNPSTGKIGTCLDLGTFKSLTAVATNLNHVYLADAGNNTVSYCKQDPSSGSLSDCKPAITTSFNNLTGITILHNQ